MKLSIFVLTAMLLVATVCAAQERKRRGGPQVEEVREVGAIAEQVRIGTGHREDRAGEQRRPRPSEVKGGPPDERKRREHERDRHHPDGQLVRPADRDGRSAGPGADRGDPHLLLPRPE